MWENIINKVMSLPFIVNEDGEIVPDILDFSSEAKAYLPTGAMMLFMQSIKSKTMDWWIAE